MYCFKNLKIMWHDLVQEFCLLGIYVKEIVCIEQICTRIFRILTEAETKKKYVACLSTGRWMKKM